MAAYGYCALIPSDNTENPDFDAYRRAVGFLSDYLERTERTLTLKLTGDDCGAHGSVAVADLFVWNDTDGQTADYVIATLRTAADDYDWTHATENDLETYADECVWQEKHPTREGFLARRGAR
jgi:hypothetical protein